MNHAELLKETNASVDALKGRLQLFKSESPDKRRPQRTRDVSVPCTVREAAAEP